MQWLKKTADRWLHLRGIALNALWLHRQKSNRWLGLTWIAVILAVICALYPSNHQRDYSDNKGGRNMVTVMAIEDGLRHMNTFVAIALPFFHRDMIGLTQLAVVAVVGTAATHIPKHMLNDVVIAGTRLGQRPINSNSEHNMPSGHSSLASAAAWFACRRYGWRWAWLLLPITLATMWARVMLDAHTVSAVFSGFFVGMAVVLFVVTPRGQRGAPEQSNNDTDQQQV